MYSALNVWLPIIFFKLVELSFDCFYPEQLKFRYSEHFVRISGSGALVWEVPPINEPHSLHPKKAANGLCGGIAGNNKSRKRGIQKKANDEKYNSG